MMRKFFSFSGLVSVVLVCFLWTGFLAAQDLRFETRQMRVGRSPGAMATGDFNNDGLPDLVVVFNFETLVVFQGDGEGRFVGVVSFGRPGETLGRVAVADLNLDGNDDLIIAVPSRHQIVVLLGTDDFLFRDLQEYTVGTFPLQVAIGDFNGDGYPDVVVPNQFGTTVQVLLGSGDGRLLPPVAFEVGYYPRSVAIGDFNGDGWLDIAAGIGSGSYNLALLFGRGDGTFNEVVPISYRAFETLDVGAGDLNAGGLADLAITGVEEGRIAVLFGQRDGLPAQYYASLEIRRVPENPVVADVTGDGRPDVVLVNHLFNSISILRNNFGMLQPPQHIQAGEVPEGAPRDAVVGDFNEDGLPDLIVSVSSSFQGYSALIILIQQP